MVTQQKENGLISSTGRSRDYTDLALGMVSTRSFPAVVGTADMMLKAAEVTLVGYEKIGSGYCTAVVRGGLSDVRIAVEAGSQSAEQFGQLVDQAIISRPLPNLDLVLPIGSRLAQLTQQWGRSRLMGHAIGLLETRGFPAMVGAADAMLKAAEVQLAAYETIGDGLCTVLIRGRVSDVAMAIEVGMHEAERIGELNAVMVIPRPLEDLERTLPVAQFWLEQPVALPLQLTEKQKEQVELPQEQVEQAVERLALPDLGKLAVPQRQPIDE